MRGEQHTDRELQHLLAVAGAIVSLDAIAAWKRYEFAEASTWAAAQIAADDQAPRGRRISVRWPTCVAIAVYGTAKKKPAKKCKRRDCREPRLPRHQLCRIHSMSRTALGA